MGSAEESTAPPASPAKQSLPPASNPTSAAPTTTTSAPAGAPAPYPEWASVQAFYTSGAPAAASPAFFSPAMASSPLARPYVWGGQPVLTPYGTPIYSPMYFQGGTYAHPSMAMAAGPPYPTVEAEGRPRSAEKPKGGDVADTGKSGDEEDDDDFQSESEGVGEGEGEGEGSSETRDESINQQDSSAARKRNLIEASQHSTATPSSSTTMDSTYSGRGQTSGKLPVSAPGRVVLPGPAPNLNIGMDQWNPHADAVMKARPNAVNIVPAMASSIMAGRKGVLPDQQWVHDERELKRQRRKQSNRESARRSRLRKQQECEELARRVDELGNENSSLRRELEQLTKDCRELEVENASIVEELTRVYGPGASSTFEGFNNDSTSMESVDGECRSHAH